MIKKIFSVRDSKGGFYNNPFMQTSMGEAERTFHQMAHDEKSIIWKYPQDFDLYYLGEFDDLTGKYKALDTPQHMTKGIDLLALTKETQKASVEALTQ